MLDGCKKNPENLSKTKVSNFFLSGISMSSISLFKIIENKHDVYRDKDCMKMFCESLSEQSIETNFKKKKMNLLSNEQQKLYQNTKICYIFKKEFEDKHLKIKNCKVREQCHYTGEYRGATRSVGNLKYIVS